MLHPASQKKKLKIQATRDYFISNTTKQNTIKTKKNKKKKRSVPDPAARKRPNPGGTCQTLTRKQTEND